MSLCVVYICLWWICVSVVINTAMLAKSPWLPSMACCLDSWLKVQSLGGSFESSKHFLSPLLPNTHTHTHSPWANQRLYVCDRRGEEWDSGIQSVPVSLSAHSDPHIKTLSIYSCCSYVIGHVSVKHHFLSHPSSLSYIHIYCIHSRAVVEHRSKQENTVQQSIVGEGIPTKFCLRCFRLLKRPTDAPRFKRMHTEEFLNWSVI